MSQFPMTCLKLSFMLQKFCQCSFTGAMYEGNLPNRNPSIAVAKRWKVFFYRVFIEIAILTYIIYIANSYLKVSSVFFSLFLSLFCIALDYIHYQEFFNNREFRHTFLRLFYRLKNCQRLWRLSLSRQHGGPIEDTP